MTAQQIPTRPQAQQARLSATRQPVAMGQSGHRFDNLRRWDASLQLGFIERDGVTRMRDMRHQGPLRVQRPFYPEGPTGACHLYLLHPPGGLVSGDALHIEARVGKEAHTLLTTPAANKLYRADRNGVAWHQDTLLQVEDGGLLEWLPQETIAFDGSRGRQRTRIELSSDARCLGWELLALGRPASQLPFVSGGLEQHFEILRDGVPLWIERQPLDPTHRRFRGNWGQRGHSVQATLWAVGLRDGQVTVEWLREQLEPQPCWAVTWRHDVLLLRYLGDSRRDAWQLLESAWTQLRPQLAGCEACVPRIWRT